MHAVDDAIHVSELRRGTRIDKRVNLMLQHCPQDFCRLRLFVALLSLERRFTRDEYQCGVCVGGKGDGYRVRRGCRASA